MLRAAVRKDIWRVPHCDGDTWLGRSRRGLPAGLFP